MYFLDQIKHQFLSNIVAHEMQQHIGPDDGFRAGEALKTSQDAGEGLAAPEQQLFQELNEELDGIDNDSKLVTSYCSILGTFLSKIKNGQIEGLSPEDSDFERLLVIYQRKFEELKDMRNKGHEIEHVISMHMSQLGKTVDSGAAGEDIDERLDQAYYEEAKERQDQEEMQKLETQRDSYRGIVKHQLGELTESQRKNLPQETQRLIQQVGILLDEDNPTNLEEAIKLNEKVTKLMNSLSLHLEFSDFESLRGGIRLALSKVDSEKLSTEHQALLKEIMNDSRVEFLDLDNIEGEREKLRTMHKQAEILIKEVYNLYKLPEEGEQREEYNRLYQQYATMRGEIDASLTPFVGKEGLTQTMQDVLERYETIQKESPIREGKFGQGNDFENYLFLKSAQGLSSLESLQIDVDIALRDQQVVGENGETLGESRLESNNAAYSALLENEEIKNALTDGEGNIPKFEELDMADIHIIQENGGNLSELFLVDEKGESISGELEQGKQYIINFSGNTHLEGKMDFAFISSKFEEITVDGRKFIFDTDQFKGEGNSFQMRDGSQIVLEKAFTDGEEAGEVRVEATMERMKNLALDDAQQEMVNRAMLSDNPQAAFEASSLPGGIIGLFVAMVLNFGDGRNFKYDAETGTFIDNGTGDPLSNADMALGRFREGDPQQINMDAGLDTQPEGVRGLVRLIYQKESRGNVNAIFGGYSGYKPDLTSMTVAEVREFQDHMVRNAGSPSSAVGAPQIIRKTMDYAIRMGVLDPNEKFDDAAQNRFTLWKLKERGLDDYMAGRIKDVEFMAELAKEWASFPKDMSGRSHYAGDGLNKALISPQQVLHQIRKI